jgi:pimeloyl-ACP methyl ester carboxylesterase
MGDRAVHRRAARSGLEAREVHSESIDLYYHVGGSAHGTEPPLLIVHGFGGDALSTWAAQLRPFAASRELLLPDLLWFGRSEGHVPPTLDAQVEAMLAMMDQEGLEQVDLMGVSYGGFVGLALLAQAPERIGRVIVVDSPGPVFSDAELDAMLARFGASEPADIFVPEGPEDVRTLIELSFAAPPPLPRFVLADIYRQHFSMNHGAWRELLDDLPRHRDRMAALSEHPPHPALVVWGEQDPVFPLAAGERLAELLDAELVVIDDTAHGPSAEAPAVFNAAVLGWLESTDGR